MLNKVKSWLLGKPKTSDYRAMGTWAFRQPRDLPIFSFNYITQMLYDPTIRLGLAMRAAPLGQCEFAYEVRNESGESKWVPGVQADKPQVGAFVLRQLKRIWTHELHKVLLDQVWGWSGGEVTFRQASNGMIEVDQFLHRSAMDTYALLRDGELAGVQVRNCKTHDGNAVDLRMPQCFWSSFNPENESPYGRSILYGAFSPWADKWLSGGALDTRRLFAHKDAYGGVDIAYPPDGTFYIDGVEVPARDIAREMAEQLKAGGVTTRPSIFDQNGKELWQITRAAVPSNPSHIFDYPKQLDVEMLRGMEIPDDVLTSEASGAWQGKQVPMQAFYTGCDRWLNQVVKTIVVQILEPLVKINYGRAEEFQVSTKPLAQQAMEQIAGAEKPDQAAGGPVVNPAQSPMQARPGQSMPVAQAQSAPGQQVRFGLEQPTIAETLVGSAVIEASKLVDAGRKVLSDANQLNRKATAIDVAAMLGLDSRETALLKRMTNGKALSHN